MLGEAPKSQTPSHVESFCSWKALTLPRPRAPLSHPATFVKQKSVNVHHLLEAADVDVV